MDNKELIAKLTAACGALNQIDVHGKQNLINLYGSIDIVESVIAILQNNIKETTSKETE